MTCGAPLWLRLLIFLPAKLMAKRTAKSKHVLLFLRQYRREIHQAIYNYARTQRWIVEFYLHVPTSWRGDGIIADWINATEVAQIRDDRPIPVVTRFHCAGDHIGHVCGDIKAIAEMGVNYFAMRGFRSMAGIDMCEWGDADPCLQFVEVANAKGYWASHFCYAKSPEDYDFIAAVNRVRVFLRALPKPCAVFLGGMHCANTVYRACELERISIPHEISILTNDDDALICETFQPQLSGIAGEINHTGMAMAKMLDGMMSRPAIPQLPVIVPPEKIITRQSTDVLAVSHLPTARAINFIFENYAKLIGVEEVSRYAGITLNALHKNFREHVGKVPSEFLREVRMNRAKELLEETDLTLDQIAKQTGYSCAMTLYAAFKRLFHLTPGAYRNQSSPHPRRRPSLAK